MPKNSNDKERELQAEIKKKLLCNAIKKVRKRKKRKKDNEKIEHKAKE